MRPSWDEIFLGQAALIAKRSTCPRLHVGCVLVRDNRPISMGYNGSVSGTAHCTDFLDGCHMRDGRCQTAIHGEANCILNAALNGVSCASSTAYITHSPCWDCLKLLAQAGIKEIVFSDKYHRFDEVMAIAAKHGIVMPFRHIEATNGDGAESL